MSTSEEPDARPASPASGAAAQSTASTASPPGPAPWDFAGSVQGNAPPAGRAHPHVPDAIERRYLKVDDRYFFPDRTLAFIDDGSRIRVRTENREVMHSVIAIAQARGWRAIELRGTEAFRQGMWREAALQGIEARGYEPTEAELRQVERAQQRSPSARAAPDATSPRPGSLGEQDRRAKAEQTDSPNASNPAESRALHDGPRPPIKGMLVAAAAAPYKFDPAQRMSFYVMVRTEVGDRTIWGADLERALAESSSQPHIGDQVVLTQRGTNPVSVRIPARNDAGELIGEKKIMAQRARWSIETPEHVRDLQRQAKLLRTGEVLADASLDMYPGLATAAAGVKLAEQYARRLTADEPSQEKLIQAIRDRMAAAVEQGRDIHLPDRKPRPNQRQVRQRGGRNREEPTHERF